MPTLRLLLKRFELCLVFFLISERLFSQTLAVSPVYFDIQADAKASQENELTVFNRSSSNMTIKLTLSDFWYNEKNERIYPELKSTLHSAANFIHFPKTTFPIKAGSSEKIKFIVTVPENFNSSAYLTAFVESVNPADAGNGQPKTTASVTFSFQVAVPILIKNKQAKYNCVLSNLVIQSEIEHGPLKISFDLLNSGNSYIFPKGSILLENPVNTENSFIGTLDFNQLRLLLPGQKQRFELLYTGDLQEHVNKTLKARITLPYSDDKLILEEKTFIPKMTKKVK